MNASPASTVNQWDGTEKSVEEVVSEGDKAMSRTDSEKRQNEIKDSWRDEWLRRQKEKVVALIHEQAEEQVHELEQELVIHLEGRDAHPSIIKRLRTNGWDHPLVRHLMIEFFARGALGDDWDKPSAHELLDIASEGQENT